MQKHRLHAPARSIDATSMPMNEQFIPHESLIQNKLLNNLSKCAQQQCQHAPMKTLKWMLFGASARGGALGVCYNAGSLRPPSLSLDRPA
jgi:hypothetical protein